MENKPTLIITGATGFLGKHFVELYRNYYNFVSIQRGNANDSDDGILAISYALLKDPMVIKKVIDSNPVAIVHLASVTGNNFHKIKNPYSTNVSLMKDLISLARNTNVNKLVFISSNAVNYSNTQYAKTKMEAEELLKNSTLNYTILRPVIIIGKNSPDIKTFTNLFKKTPFIPMLNNGIQRLKPVYIDDVCEYIHLSITSPNTINKTYNVSGGEIISFREFITELLKLTGYKKLLIPIPNFIISTIKALLANTSIINQISSLEVDLDTDNSNIIKDTGKTPLRFSSYMRKIY